MKNLHIHKQQHQHDFIEIEINMIYLSHEES